MAENSAISWTDHTFNPWIGCTKVSPACDGCYAEAMMGETGRFKRVTWGAPGKGDGTRDRTSPSNWAKVRAWNREAAAAPGKTFVFCASLADVFDNAAPAEWRRDLFDLIHATPNLTWLLLTKRPGMILKLFDAAYRRDGEPQTIGERAGNWPQNAAIGCTVISQEEADRDVPKLLAAKAALRPAFAFLSMEPLLGGVDISRFMWPVHASWPAKYRSPSEAEADGSTVTYHRQAMVSAHAMFLDWVITGGETDQGEHKARPHNPAWFRSLRDQCAAAGVPYHHKQNGEWVAIRELPATRAPHPDEVSVGANGEAVRRVGKTFDPCTLDGELHRARPPR